MHDEDDRADVAGAKDRPGQRVPAGRRPARRGDRPVAGLPRRATFPDEALADARDAHLLAGGGRGRDVEQVARQPRLSDAPRSYARRSTPGRHVDVNTGGSAKTDSSASAG